MNIKRNFYFTFPAANKPKSDKFVVVSAEYPLKAKIEFLSYGYTNFARCYGIDDFLEVEKQLRKDNIKLSMLRAQTIDRHHYKYKDYYCLAVTTKAACEVFKLMLDVESIDYYKIIKNSI